MYQLNVFFILVAAVADEERYGFKHDNIKLKPLKAKKKM